MLLQLSHSPPLFPSALHTLSHPHPPSSSCPWVIYISSLAPPYPILFLSSPYLFCTYHVCFLFHLPFPPFFSISLPTDSPPCVLLNLQNLNSALNKWFSNLSWSSLFSSSESCEGWKIIKVKGGRWFKRINRICSCFDPCSLTLNRKNSENKRRSGS